MAWQSNVGGGWTNDHDAPWDRGTPPQRAWPLEMPQARHRTPAAPRPPQTRRGSPGRHVPAIEYHSHPWGYTTLETETIRSARTEGDVGGRNHATAVPPSSLSTRASRPSVAARAALETELAATRAKIVEMRLLLGVRQNTPPQVMLVPTPGVDAQRLSGEAEQLARTEEGSDGGTTARLLRLARSAIRQEEERAARKPLTPPTPRRPRDRRRGPNGQPLVKKEQQPRQPRPKHDFSQRALPFLKRLNTYNDPKFNFPKQKTDVTKVN